MGVEGEKSRMLKTLTMQAGCEKMSIILTDEEWQRVERLTQWVTIAVAQGLEREAYVSQNVLEHTMASVVAMIMKLNVDMFGEVGGEADHMAMLIKHAWKAIKDKKIDY